MSDSLTYRLFRDSDLPGVLQLWEESSGWGSITAEVWREWYVDTPLGPSLVVVAEDEGGSIVGQEVLMPSVVCVGDQDVAALRISAPILNKDIRHFSLRSINHPITRLTERAMELAVTRGYGLVYVLPMHAWLSWFQWAGTRIDALQFAEADYACLSAPIAQVSPGVTDGAKHLIARPVTDFGVEYAQLWATARDSFPITCGVVRSPDWLRYKNGGRLALEIRERRDGSLVGYTAIKQQTALLVDILARHPTDLPSVLAATLTWLAARRDDLATGSLDSLKAMETPVLRPALRALGFTPIDYKFAFVCRALDPSLSREAIAPERWYLTPEV
ncbi:MAG: GNAT family N-acetyltransferase [Chloroflexota bacterium]|nr:GNAT family N-acetyltransferase [Chloroflexota bacterium]